MFTILVGRFVGPTRPLVPWWQGCWICRWRNLLRQILSVPVMATVLLPAGDSGGCGDRIPAGMQSGEFKWLLLVTAVFCGLVAGCAGGYGAAVKRLTVESLFVPRSFVVVDAVDFCHGVVALVVLIRHPLMPVYIDICVKWLGVRG